MRGKDEIGQAGRHKVARKHEAHQDTKDKVLEVKFPALIPPYPLISGASLEGGGGGQAAGPPSKVCPNVAVRRFGSNAVFLGHFACICHTETLIGVVKSLRKTHFATLTQLFNPACDLRLTKLSNVIKRVNRSHVARG